MRELEKLNIWHLFRSLRKKCPNTEFFLVRISLYSDWIGRKYGPEKTPYLDTFHGVCVSKNIYDIGKEIDDIDCSKFAALTLFQCFYWSFFSNFTAINTRLFTVPILHMMRFFVMPLRWFFKVKFWRQHKYKSELPFCHKAKVTLSF